MDTLTAEHPPSPAADRRTHWVNLIAWARRWAGPELTHLGLVFNDDAPAALAEVTIADARHYLWRSPLTELVAATAAPALAGLDRLPASAAPHTERCGHHGLRVALTAAERTIVVTELDRIRVYRTVPTRERLDPVLAGLLSSRLIYAAVGDRASDVQLWWAGDEDDAAQLTAGGVPLTEIRDDEIHAICGPLAERADADA